MNDKTKTAILDRLIRVLAMFILLSVLLYKGAGSSMMAQNIGISTNGAVPDPSALLDINASPNGNQGLLIPRLTMAQRDNLATSCSCTPAQTLLIFNTTDSCFETYLGTTWHPMWCTTGTCPTPIAPTAGTSVAAAGQIDWNWNTVEGATGYQWNTSNTYPGSGIDTVSSANYIEPELNCATSYTLYVWAYNQCGVSVSPVALTQTTSACPSCGPQLWAPSNLVLTPISTYSVTMNPDNQPQDAGMEWCANDVAANCAIYGGLFDWSNATGLLSGAGGAATTCNPCGSMGIQGLCPTNYHVPTDLEWSQYEYCLESTVAPTGTTTLATFQTTNFGYRGSTSSTAGVYQGPGAKLKMTAAQGGNWAFTSYTNNNLSNFGALASGYDWIMPGPVATFQTDFLGVDGAYWTATEINPGAAGQPDGGAAYNRLLTSQNLASDAQVYRTIYYGPEGLGLSVRCLHN
jgi:uncharacterized protein (TIGR02145 family)